MSATSLVEQALLIGALLKDSRFSRGSQVGRMFIIVSSLLLGVGFCFLLYAAFDWASIQYGTQMAAAGIGTIVVLLALLVMICAALYHNERNRRIKSFASRSTNKAEAVIANLLHSLEDPIKGNPKLSVLLSAFTGYTAGKTFR